MTTKNLFIKSIVTITICAYFTYALFWAVKTLPLMLQIFLKPESYLPSAGLTIINSYSLTISYLMESVGFVGLLIRLIASIFAVLGIISFLKTGSLLSPKSKKYITNALLLEGIHFITFIPAIIYLLTVSALPLTSNLCLAAALTTQIILISPLLILLSYRFAKTSTLNPQTKSMVRLATITCFSYMSALWITYLLKWVEMSALDGFNWLLSWPIKIAYFNTLIIFSLSIIFAAVGTIKLFRIHNNTKASRWLKWWGISIVFFSVHLIVFVVYCFTFNSAWMAQFGELWIIPLIVAGIYMLLKK